MIHPLQPRLSSASPKAVKDGEKSTSTFFDRLTTHSPSLRLIATMNGPISTYGGGSAGGSAEMGDAQTMAAVKNVRSLSTFAWLSANKILHR